jgi:release factor glutamine methyltransferase
LSDIAVNVATARSHAATRLAGASDTPQLDSDVLLGHALGLSRAGLIARAGDVLASADAERFWAFIERRLAGEPIAYITGRKAFRMIELIVDERVLVPRPETEMLVEIGLLGLGMRPGHRCVLDVGTGSGAVGLALASELRARGRHDVSISASDISQDAIDVARANRRRLRLDIAVELVRADLLEGLSGPFDMVLANLPYLRVDQRHPSTAREPDLALYAGAEGMDVYRRLLEQLPGALALDGVIACEIDPGQAQAVRELACRIVPGEARVLKDLAGRERVLLAGAVDIVRTVAETFEHGDRSGRD